MTRWIVNLALVLVVIASNKVLAHDFVVEGLAYNIVDGKAVVTYKGNYSSDAYRQTEIVIPEEVTYKEVTYPVTSIGNYAFNNCYMLQNIVIPNSITAIGAGAFTGCSGLTSIVIPNTVETIGDYALQCRELKTLSLSCRQIGKDALKGLNALESIESPDATADGRCLIIDGVLRLFAPVSLTEYEIAEGVTSIDSNVFSDNKELESISLPSGLVSISSNAFYNCQALKRINIPSTVKIIDTSFSSCKSLCEVRIEDIDSYCHITGYPYPIFNAKVDFIDYSGKTIEDIVFPGDVKILGRHLFSKSSIRSIVIEEGVEEIEYDALRNCQYLTTVSIPASVSKIGNAAFRGCTRLSDFVYGATDATAGYHIKEDREDEHSYIFSECPSLTNVEILSSVRSLPEYLFAESNIKTIVFPPTLQNIGNSIFYLGKLEEAKFEGSPIVGEVFNRCSALRKVTLTTSVPPSASYLGSFSNASLYVPEGSISAYSQAPGWSVFKNILTEQLPGIAGHIFESGSLRFEIIDQDLRQCKVTSAEPGKDYFGEVAIPEVVSADDGETYTVVSIDESAFTYTNKVTAIKIPNTISVISGIDNTTVGLKRITVEDDNPSYSTVDGVLFDKEITALLLYPAAKTGSYTVPSTVISVGSNLAAKINLEDLTVSDSVEGWLYMSNSLSLKSLKTGNGVSMFSVTNCPALEYLEIGSGVESIRGENFGAEYHDVWNTNGIKNLIFADSPNPILIYTMSVDDGYLSAIPTSNCEHIYVGRDLKAAGSPLKQHFSSQVKSIEFGPEVTRLDAQLLLAMQYEINDVTVPSANFWASIPRMYSGYSRSYSLFIDGMDEPDLYITSENVMDRAFYNVKNIKTITLSENVKSIGTNAFETYSPIESLILENHDPANISVTGDPVRNYDRVELVVPTGTKSLYENAEPWSKFDNIVERDLPDHDITFLPSISNICLDKSSAEIYDLYGRQVDPDNLQRGIYIMRDSNGKTVKMRL